MSLFGLDAHLHVVIFLIFCCEKILNFTWGRAAKVRERVGFQGRGAIFGHSCQLVRTSDNIVAIVLHRAALWRRKRTEGVFAQNGERFKWSCALGLNQRLVVLGGAKRGQHHHSSMFSSEHLRWLRLYLFLIDWVYVGVGCTISCFQKLLIWDWIFLEGYCVSVCLWPKMISSRLSRCL